jgi:hypothetical protein
MGIFVIAVIFLVIKITTRKLIMQHNGPPRTFAYESTMTSQGYNTDINGVQRELIMPIVLYMVFGTYLFKPKPSHVKRCIQRVWYIPYQAETYPCCHKVFHINDMSKSELKNSKKFEFCMRKFKLLNLFIQK